LLIFICCLPTFYVDRAEKPHADENGNVPEKNDYRFVVSLGDDFNFYRSNATKM